MGDELELITGMRVAGSSLPSASIEVSIPAQTMICSEEFAAASAAAKPEVSRSLMLVPNAYWTPGQLFVTAISGLIRYGAVPW